MDRSLFEPNANGRCLNRRQAIQTALVGFGAASGSALLARSGLAQEPEDKSPAIWDSSRPPDVIHYAPAAARDADPWSPQKIERIEGQVVELNDTTLTLVTEKGTRNLPSDRVERVDVVWSTPEAKAAHEQFVRREYKGLLKKVVEAGKGDLPTWEQRVLIGEAIEAEEALGQIGIAGELFFRLASNKPPAFIVAAMPLNWTTRESSADLQRIARGWLEATDDDFKGLLGASWLLLTPSFENAKSRLQSLNKSSSILVRQLAAAQLWRTVPPPETLSNLATWRTSRSRMLHAMQIGPSEFLADRFHRIGESTLAISEWMRIASEYGHRFHRAKRAMEAIQNQLVLEHQTEQAEKMAAWIKQVESVATSN